MFFAYTTYTLPSESEYGQRRDRKKYRKMGIYSKLFQIKTKRRYHSVIKCMIIDNGMCLGPSININFSFFTCSHDSHTFLHVIRNRTALGLDPSLPLSLMGGPFVDCECIPLCLCHVMTRKCPAKIVVHPFCY